MHAFEVITHNMVVNVFLDSPIQFNLKFQHMGVLLCMFVFLLWNGDVMARRVDFFYCIILDSPTLLDALFCQFASSTRSKSKPSFKTLPLVVSPFSFYVNICQEFHLQTHICDRTLLLKAEMACQLPVPYTRHVAQSPWWVCRSSDWRPSPAG